MRGCNLVLITAILIYHVKTSEDSEKDYKNKNNDNSSQDNDNYTESDSSHKEKKSQLSKSIKKAQKNQVKQEGDDTKKYKCSNVVKHYNNCPEFKNCLYYQVSQNYADLGCSVCNKDYELIEDEEGSGYCVRVSKKSVKNCQINAVSPMFGKGQPICYKCDEGYVLNYDMRSCLPGHLTKCTKIDNCQAYSELNDGKKTVVCDLCKAGYTLSQDKTECLNGCHIENCNSCANINGENKCRICNAGTIGVFDATSIVYSECMTCNTWSCKLLTKKAQDCCLKEKF